MQSEVWMEKLYRNVLFHFSYLHLPVQWRQPLAQGLQEYFLEKSIKALNPLNAILLKWGWVGVGAGVKTGMLLSAVNFIIKQVFLNLVNSPVSNSP